MVFNKEDPFIVTLKNAILKCGSSVKCCRNIEETHEAFKKINYDLVFIDSRRTTASIQLHSSTTSTASVTTTSGRSNSSTTSFSTTTTPPITTSTSSSATSNQQYDYENICWYLFDSIRFALFIIIYYLNELYSSRDNFKILSYYILSIIFF